ncbi:MAG: hypothetical protein ACLTT1_20185 [[Clostridium] scindens]
MGYEMLFTPFKIGKMEVKNRLVMSPMGTNSAFTNGRKDAQEIDYFIERAKGGVGMIIMGCQPLNEEIAQGSMEGYMDSFSVLPALTSVCDGVHRYGAKIVCQLRRYRAQRISGYFWQSPHVGIGHSFCIQSRYTMPGHDQGGHSEGDGWIRLCGGRGKGRGIRCGGDSRPCRISGGSVHVSGME